MTTKAACEIEFRWLIRADLPEVLDIEQQSFDFSWTQEDFLSCLRQRNCIGMVAEHQERIVGFMVYELLKSQLHVLKFAVAPWFLRRGAGRRMVEKLKGKLAQQLRESILLEVRESNLAGQLFFQRMGFRAVDVLREHFDDGETAYRMRCVIERPGTKSQSNRVSQYFEDGHE